MSQPLLQVKGLQIHFQQEGKPVPAVNGISFDVQKGEMLAIVGESGSGKSVTALSLLHLLPDSAVIKGQQLFSGKNTDKFSDLVTFNEQAIRNIRGREISMIFQEPMTSLNPLHTCGRQVMEVVALHLGLDKTAAKAKVLELFARVKLPEPADLFNRYPHQLSGGQKQRVMIAMAIATNPSLLIADEPTTALDVTVQKAVLELLKELQQEYGMSVILVSHDLALVASLADKIVVMYQGAVVESGFAKDVFTNPVHPYTKALLACRPALYPRGSRLPVVSDFLQNEKGSIKAEVVKDKPSTIQADQPPALEVKELLVSYPKKKSLFGKSLPPFIAVDRVSFTVSKGETVGLVGESGCGKTTLGRAVLQLVKPTSGSISLDGKELATLSPESLRRMRRELQIVFQDPYGSLNPSLTIGEAIAEPMKVHGIGQNQPERKERVMHLLEKVKLDPRHFNRYPHQFSGGQRQRICIARALAIHPSFLVFDESVSALDVSVQASVLNLLNDLKAEFGFSSIFISHDLSVVRYISDRILVMRQGKVIEEGDADELYLHPVNAYTKMLIDSIPGNPGWNS